MTSLVFVYGTLKRGHGRNNFMRPQGSQFLGETKTLPLYTMHNLGSFPAIVAQGTTAISGEVYEVDEKTLDILDQIEGNPNFYRRELIHTDFGEAWAYFLPAGRVIENEIIRTGVWERGIY